MPNYAGNEELNIPSTVTYPNFLTFSTTPGTTTFENSQKLR